jgi:hypothetical protein
MSKIDGFPSPQPEPSLGVIQAMLDIGLAQEQEALLGHSKRERDQDGFLAAHPDYYERLANAIIDLIQAHPEQGPQALPRMLRNIEWASYLRQDQGYVHTKERQQETEAKMRRRRESPTKLERFLDRMRGEA